MKESKVCRLNFIPGILSPPLSFLISLSFLLLILSPNRLAAQDEDEYYEISVNLEVQRLGGYRGGCCN